jgi:hypothetical protein
MRTILVICSILLVAASLLFLTPNPTAVQQFYIRILIALAAAGVAMLIPGFFEIELGWLRNTIRAGGALGIFLLIYAVNPPTFEQLRQLEELAGEYEYECTKDEGAFSHGGFQHGGIARLRIVTTAFGKACSISGERLWLRINKDGEQIPVDTPSIWQTQGCNFTADDKIIYQYVTTEKGARFLGTSILKIERDKPEGIHLAGSFQREAPAQNTYGTVVMKKIK